MEEIHLQIYEGEQDEAVKMIQAFWLCHNGIRQERLEALLDLEAWTKVGHAFYWIRKGARDVGFVHLGSRGAEMNWLEDLFVLPSEQGKGIGSKALQLAEALVRTYSDSFYIEVAARNERALRLYRHLGFDCLNTLTIRKDFKIEDFDCLRKEKIYDLDFEIRRLKEIK